MHMSPRCISTGVLKNKGDLRDVVQSFGVISYGVSIQDRVSPRPRGREWSDVGDLCEVKKS